MKGKIGEVHRHWHDAVEAARTAVTNQDDGPLRNLLAWRLRTVERLLQHQRERLEEEGFARDDDA